MKAVPLLYKNWWDNNIIVKFKWVCYIYFIRKPGEKWSLYRDTIFLNVEPFARAIFMRGDTISMSEEKNNVNEGNCNTDKSKAARLKKLIIRLKLRVVQVKKQTVQLKLNVV